MPAARKSGRANKLTGQVGEYLVAAELARRGLIATTFTGNVPHYDIVASDERGRHASVQVKTSTGKSWQFSIDRFCEIKFRGRHQLIGRARAIPVRGLVVVLVMLGASRELDRYFVTSWLKLRNIVIRNHRNMLRSHRGQRPRNFRSLHAAISESQLERYENCWPTILRSLR